MTSLEKRLLELAAAERDVAAGMDMRPEDTANGQYAKTADDARLHIINLELALYRIAGNGNITGDKAREIACEALGIAKLN